MTQCRVKALVEVEYDVEYTGKMASALEEAEDLIITIFSNNNLLQSCELKKVKIQLEDN